MNALTPTGRIAGRFLRSLGLGGGDESAVRAFRESQQRLEKAAGKDIRKAAVGAVQSTDITAAAAQNDFMEAVRPYALLSRLTRIRQVPARTKMIAFGAGTIAYRVGQRKNIPISKPELMGIAIEPVAKVAALSVATKETLAIPGMAIEVALTDDLAKAVAAAEDLVFLDPVEPGSILNGAPTRVSAIPNTDALDSDGIDNDLQAAINLLLAAGGMLQDAAWIMSSVPAARIAGMRSVGGAAAFPDLGVNGGTMLGLPVFVSESAAGYLALIDQAGIVMDEDAGVKFSLSENVMLQMTDDPTDLPAAPALLISIFQTECVAFKAVSYRSWKTRAGAGVYVTGGIW